jgi:predicted nucleic acid-binding protein
VGGAVTEAGTSAGRAILDTSVLLADQVAPISGWLAISVITLAELNFGVLVARSAEVRAERLRRLSLLQQRFDALPVDEAVSVSYGRLAAAVVDAGRRPRGRVRDLLIAATAHAHGARLYTRNVVDFTGLEDLVDIVEV